MDVFYFEPRDPSSNGEEKGRKKEGREAKGWKQEKWRAEGKKLRRHAVMDWPGPITSFVSICAEYCS